MEPKRFFRTIVQPTLAMMEAHPAIRIPVTPKGNVLVMTCAGQESLWKSRRQIRIGQYHPQSVGARSYWQMESTWGGPVAINDVIQDTPRQLFAICEDLEIPTDELSLYEACAWNDTLACALARLLLWSDPAPLPEVGDKQGSWDYYRRNWKPGVPHPSTWSARYDASLAAMQP